MIKETLSNKRRPALTSNRWHVVHARWSGERGEGPSFVRTIVSEHDERGAAAHAAREIVSRLSAEMSTRPLSERDQLFIRKPGFRSLKVANRVKRRRK